MNRFVYLINRQGGSCVNIGGNLYEPDHDTGIFTIPYQDAQKIVGFKQIWATPDEIRTEQEAARKEALSLDTLSQENKALREQVSELTGLIKDLKSERSKLVKKTPTRRTTTTKA